jgi:CheY-like chemotaxis protein
MEEKINILLVDDNPQNLMALEAVLTSPEYNLVLADSGKAALRFLLKLDFAMILMDVQMPDMDGYETAHHKGYCCIRHFVCL